MKWTLFVLDFDGTYDNEPKDEDGVQPVVYLIPTKKVKDAKRCAQKAHDDFFEDDEYEMCIGDYFEEWLMMTGIQYKLVGDIKLTFGERIGNYLSKDIEMCLL